MPVPHWNCGTLCLEKNRLVVLLTGPLRRGIPGITLVSVLPLATRCPGGPGGPGGPGSPLGPSGP